MQGQGLKEIAQKAYNFGKNVYNTASDVNKYLKNKRYAGRLVEAIPETANLPIVGNYIRSAANMGYGAKMKGMGPGINQTPTQYGTF